MRYMLLIYGDPSIAETMTPEEGQKIMSDYYVLTQSIVESGEPRRRRAAPGRRDRHHRTGPQRPDGDDRRPVHRRPRRSSAATTSSTARISTVPSSWPAASPARSTDRSRFAQ